jgi:hypothetical protein
MNHEPSTPKFTEEKRKERSKKKKKITRKHRTPLLLLLLLLCMQRLHRRYSRPYIGTSLALPALTFPANSSTLQRRSLRVRARC